MAISLAHLSVDNRLRQYPPPPSPSNFYTRPPIPLDYNAPLPPVADNPHLEFKRPANLDACFAVSALSPQVPGRYMAEKESVGTTLLDRFLYYQSMSPMPGECCQTPAQAWARTPITPAQAWARTPVTPAQPQHAPAGSSLWAFQSTPCTPGNPRNVWAFMGQAQPTLLPPPPPPPQDGRHSRVETIEDDVGSSAPSVKTNSTSTSTSSFRQEPRGLPPRPLTDRAIISRKQPTNKIAKPAPITDMAAVPQEQRTSKVAKPANVPAKIKTQQPASRPKSQRLTALSPKSPQSPIKLPPPSRKHAPTPIDVQLSRNKAAARLEGISTPRTAPSRDAPLRSAPLCSPPLSAKTNGSITPRANPVSSPRGIQLSPIITKVETLSKVRLDTVMSPIASPPPMSPRSFASRGRSPTPPLWSPQTPVAMSYEFPIIMASTPSFAPSTWGDCRDTIIEEEYQVESPLELAPPRGRQFQPSLMPNRDAEARQKPRPRSVSPPRSAYPDGDPLHILSPVSKKEVRRLETPKTAGLDSWQMEEGEGMYYAKRTPSNPRQAILSSYFKKGGY